MSIADGVAAGLDPSWPGMPVMVVAGAIAAAMAWAIGAQDVSNCFGTAVGSKALTVTQAVLIAAVCEFLGSLAGGDVAATLATGILDMDALTAMGDEGVALYMRCMLATMAGAVAWLVIATVYSLPVSTTHSLVGALLGVGLLATGSAKWSTLGGVLSSWVTSPLMGCGISYFVYSRIRSQLLLAASPLAAVRASLPLYYGGTAAAMALFLGLIGPKAYRLSYSSAAITAAVVFFGVYFAVRSPSRAMHATARATATGAASQPDDAAPDSVAIEDDRAEAGRASGGGDLADQRLHGRKRDSDGARGQGGAEDAQSDGAAATDSQGAASPSEASLLTAPDGNAAPSSARGRRGAAGKARGQRAGIFGGIVGAGGAREGKVDGGKDVGGASSSAPDEQKGATASLSISGAASPGGASDCGSPDADAGTAPSAGAAELEASEAEFVRLMVVTSCVLSFSHGSQDVSNAAAPYAAVVAVAAQQQLNAASAAPTWVLAAGGVGIVVGLATYGYKVMATVGTGITKLTFSKGFAAQLATALTALTATLLGLTVSTTHVMIGAIAGVALADGPDKLNTGMLKKIAASWIITLPASAGLAALAYGALSLAHTPSVPVLAA